MSLSSWARCFVAATVLLSAGARAQDEDAGAVPDDDAGVALVDAGVAEPVAAPAVAVTVPAPPREEPRYETPARVQASESLVAAYHLDNGNIAPKTSIAYDPTGSNYLDVFNRLQLDAAWNSLTASVRVDSALFANTPQAAPGDTRIEQLLINRYANRLDFEKVNLSYTSRFLDVTVGDSYQTYGRGLVLSLRKVDEFGIDTTVRGINATGRIAGLTVNAIAGVTNTLNIDPATGREYNDPNDIVFAGRAEYRFGRYAAIGFDASHFIYSQNFQTSAPQKARDQVTSFSGTIELPHLGEFGTFYAELAAQRRLTQDNEQWSWALYSTASIYIQKLTLLLEYKDYRNYQNILTSIDPTQAPELALTDFYSAAPTLERVQQIVLNNTDVTGGHVRASYRINENITPYVSMAFIVDRGYTTQIYDPYAGVEVRWNDGQSRASLSGGYRLNEYVEGSAAPGTPFQTAAHFEYDVSQHIKGPYAAEVSGLHYTHHDWQGASYLDWNEGQLYLSFKRAQTFSVALGYEYYTETPASIRSNYFNVSGTWNIINNLLVRLFVGGQRAGIKCVNGVCRNFPAFEGARLEVVAKY